MEIFYEMKKVSSDQTYLDSYFEEPLPGQSGGKPQLPVCHSTNQFPPSLSLLLLQEVQILTIQMTWVQSHPLLLLSKNPHSPQNTSYVTGKNCN
jgi:hypothetical protein